MTMKMIKETEGTHTPYDREVRVVRNRIALDEVCGVLKVLRTISDNFLSEQIHRTYEKFGLPATSINMDDDTLYGWVKVWLHQYNYIEKVYE